MDTLYYNKKFQADSNFIGKIRHLQEEFQINLDLMFPDGCIDPTTVLAYQWFKQQVCEVSSKFQGNSEDSQLYSYINTNLIVITIQRISLLIQTSLGFLVLFWQNPDGMLCAQWARLLFFLTANSLSICICLSLKVFLITQIEVFLIAIHKNIDQHNQVIRTFSFMTNRTVEDLLWPIR